MDKIILFLVALLCMASNITALSWILEDAFALTVVQVVALYCVAQAFLASIKVQQIYSEGDLDVGDEIALAVAIAVVYWISCGVYFATVQWILG